MSLARYLSKLGALLTSDGKITAAGIADGVTGKFNGIHANGAIPALYAGGYVYIDGSATSVTLPSASDVPDGSFFWLQNTTPGLVVTVSCYGSEYIWDDNSVTSFVIPYLNQVCLMKSGSGSWQMVMKQKTPNYGSGVGCAYNTATQAPRDGVVIVAASGAYRNGYAVYAGVNSSTTNLLATFGDDINNNTKGGSFSFPIKQGSWFKVVPWLTDGFETMTITFYPNV